MRYTALSEADRESMLKTIGVKSINELFSSLPEKTRSFDLPGHKAEIEVEREMKEISRKNLTCSDAPSFLGAGNYRHHVPAALDYLIQRGEFLTSYTPYQPEISQGTLQTIYEFQTQVSLITDMEISNASMYDAATSCAEAVSMACRINKRNNVLISGGLHPHYIDVIKTQLQFLDLNFFTSVPCYSGDENLFEKIDNSIACVIVQNPSFFGDIQDYTELAKQCNNYGSLLVVAVAEPLSLGLFKPPGAMNADIVVCEGQSLAGPLSFGGPGLGLFSTRKKFVRQMPGRICGETVDVNNKRGFVLTMSTREQHIRREKATSNICTNSGLVALAFSIHMTLLGEKGFRRLAEINHLNAVFLAEKLERISGIRILTKNFFNEFTLQLPSPAESVVEELAKNKILGGVPVSRFYPNQSGLEDLMLVAITELNTESEINEFIDVLGRVIK